MELGQEAASVPVPVVGWAQVMAPASAREAAVASVAVFLRSVAAFQLLNLFPLLIPNTQRKRDEPRARELASFGLLSMPRDGHEISASSAGLVSDSTPKPSKLYDNGAFSQR